MWTSWQRLGQTEQCCHRFLEMKDNNFRRRPCGEALYRTFSALYKRPERSFSLVLMIFMWDDTHSCKGEHCPLRRQSVHVRCGAGCQPNLPSVKPKIMSDLQGKVVSRDSHCLGGGLGFTGVAPRRRWGVETFCRGSRLLRLVHHLVGGVKVHWCDIQGLLPPRTPRF